MREGPRGAKKTESGAKNETVRCKGTGARRGGRVAAHARGERGARFARCFYSGEARCRRTVCPKVGQVSMAVPQSGQCLRACAHARPMHMQPARCNVPLRSSIFELCAPNIVVRLEPFFLLRCVSPRAGLLFPTPFTASTTYRHFHPIAEDRATGPGERFPKRSLDFLWVFFFLFSFCKLLLFPFFGTVGPSKRGPTMTIVGGIFGR